MARRPDPAGSRQPVLRRPDGSSPFPVDRTQPLARVTAGAPDSKLLLEALRWVMSLPHEDGRKKEG